MPWKKGQSGNPKGSKPGTGVGRKKDEFIAKAEAIGDPLAVIQFYWDVATGKDMEQVVTDAGVSISVPAQVKDRLRAGELYLDRVIGKVPQGLEVGDPDGNALSTIPDQQFERLLEAVERGSVKAGSSGTGQTS